jgi:hypothetical protein
MSRPFPNGRRRRRGHRPPNRYKKDRASSRSFSYMDFGMRHIYQLMPFARGRELRQLFNNISSVQVIIVGLFGAMLCGGLFGPIGFVIGLLGGMSVAERFLTEHRYYRP